MPGQMTDGQARGLAPNANRAVMQGIVQTVLVYAGFSALWILLSDRMVAWLFTDPDWITLVSILKGWLFVLVTSLLLLGLLRRVVGVRSDAAEARWVSFLPGRGLVPVVLVILITAVSTVGYTLMKHRDTDIARLQGVAGLMAEQVSGWLAEREKQAEFIMGDESVTEDYYRWQGAGDPSSGVRLLSRLAQLPLHRGFSEVVFLDPDGAYLWSTGEAPLTQAPELADAVAKAARDGQVHRVGPYLDEKGQPRLDFVAAFPAALGAPPLVVLRTDPTSWLYSTLQNWPVPSATGETLLLRRDGDAFVVLNQPRYHPTPLLRVEPQDAKGFVADEVLRGKVPPGNLASGSDYRGVAVIGVVRAIAGTDWMLVAKMNRSELWMQAASDVVWIGLASLLTLAAAVFGARSLRQREQLAVAEGIQQSQAERLRALNLLAAIADGSTDAIFAKDPQGRYTMLNGAGSRLVGKSAEEALGRDDGAFFPAEQADRIMALDRELIAAGHVQTVEQMLTTAEGERLFHVTNGPLRDADGQVAGVFGIARDVTESKLADIALRESESRFRALVEQTLAGIYIIQDGVFRYVNQGFAAIFGYASPEEVMGRLTVAEFVVPEDLARVEANIRARLAGMVSDVHYAFSALRENGERLEVEIHGRASEYQGRPALIGLLLDISERKVAEEALRKQAEELARRNAELERFNRAMVGRELDVLVLKQQINGLSLALGREAPFDLGFIDAAAPHAVGENA